MTPAVLRKGIAAQMFIFGADPKPPKINTEIPKAPEMPREDGDEDDFEEDFSHIDDQNARRIAQLSRENNKRRLQNKEAKKRIEALESENAQLRKELEKVPALQNAYEDIKAARERDMDNLKNMAILRAIESDVALNDKGEEVPRAWYDVNMVRSLLKTEEIAVDLNDFSVGGLREQLDKIATEKPFLVKEAGGKTDEANQQRPPSGFAPQSSATGNPSQQQKVTEQEMRAAFPAMQNLI